MFELKAVHGNTLNFKSHIKKNQWEGLLEESYKPGVNAGILVWFIDKDETYFIDIFKLYTLKESGEKSFNVTNPDHVNSIFVNKVEGIKKRVFFEYSLKQLLEDLSYEE